MNASRKVSSLVQFALLAASTTLCRQQSSAFSLTSCTSRFSSTRLNMSSSAAASASAICSLLPLEDGSTTLTEEDSVKERLAGKRVALYFSAGWCPMCTSFEPALQSFREACKESNKEIELIYVPSDRSPEAASQRAQAMGMLSIPFERAGDLKTKFKIWAGAESMKFGFGRRSGVPAIVVLDKDAGEELAFLATESQGPRALGDWPLDDETKGVW